MYEIAGCLFLLPNLVIFIVVYTINTVILFIQDNVHHIEAHVVSFVSFNLYSCI